MKQRIFWVGLLAILSLSFAAACNQTSASSPSPVVIAETAATTTVATENTTGTATSGGLTAMYDQFYGAEVYLDGNTVVINTDDIPDHQSPYFQVGHPQYTDPHAGMIKNPGEILTQDITLRVPLNPAVSSASDTNLGAIGVAVNGVGFFNQYAAGFQALDDEILTFDAYNGGQVLIFLSNLRMVPRARLSCWFLRRAFGEELVSKFLDSPDCENIHPYAAPFTRCGQQDCEREFYRGLLGKEVRNDFRPTFEFSEGALE